MTISQSKRPLRMSRARTSVPLLMAFLIAAGPLLASDGDLDPTFGVGGKVLVNLGGFDVIAAVALQSDGKIVAAGRVFIQVDPITYREVSGLARLNVDGSLDPTFGGGGRVITDLGTGGVNAIAIQADGKILAATGGGLSSRDFALSRYNSDGSLDQSFGAGGQVITDFGLFENAHAIALQTDGKIVLAGSQRVSNSGNTRVRGVALARYNSDGSLDTAFGLTGMVSTYFGDPTEAHALGIQPDGKIVVAGGPAVAGRPFLARYNSDGSLDMAFRGGSVVGGLATGFETVAIQSDGKIIAGGRSQFGDFALHRFNSDGSVDASFGAGGAVTTDFSGNDSISALAIQIDGKIVVAGTAGDFVVGCDPTFPGGPDFALARYNSDGLLDATFGVFGTLTTNFGFYTDRASAVAIQTDGKVVVAGSVDYVSPPYSGDFALVRYNINTQETTTVTGIRFIPPSIEIGNSYAATFSGINLTSSTYIDVRFRSPGSDMDQVALNWQIGTSANHFVPIDIALGTWTITGARSHSTINDHSGRFSEVFADLTVVPRD